MVLENSESSNIHTLELSPEDEGSSTTQSLNRGYELTREAEAGSAEAESTEEEEEQEEEEDEKEDEDDSDLESVTLESLSDTILRELEQGIYTCLVCTLEIDRESEIWSCQNCYRVYDLECIGDWAKRGTSTTKDKKWRCPNCNIENSKVPTKFTCWCGKVENPEVGLIPFSCGNICNAKYSNCIHSCSSVCHPAEHPICGAMGPDLKCHCGKSSKQLPCLITPYKQGWRCEESCGTIICDLGHKCTKGCHKGFCGSCKESITGKCYCGAKELTIQCHEKYLQKSTEFIGIGKCDVKTKKFYDCNEHFEIIDCQILTPTQPCKLSPKYQKTCYCGKTLDGPRQKCTDPILECDQVCGKLLPCGCKCNLKCHSGECECFNIKAARCSCNNFEFITTCKALQQGFVPQCNHKCDALLSCRRHYHKAVCCSYEPVALERERKLKKAMRNKTISNTTQDIMTIEPIHICYKTCNRLRSCGKHFCDSLCHPGSCPPCLESTNDDLICNCGKTVIPAPVRCGTVIKCNEQCIRPKDCGHAPEIHKCHSDDVPCRKCTTLVTKRCECGRSEIPNVLCSGPLPKCAYTCLETRDCGHKCFKNCSADCNKGLHLTSASCQSSCDKLRTSCPHKCKMKCHVNKTGQSSSCDAKVCSELVTLTCECGRLSNKVPCNASSTQESTIGSKLHCDDTCMKLKNDLELQKIFNIGNEDKKVLDNQLIYSKYVISTYQRQLKWCLKVEVMLRDFMKSNNKALHFPIMNHPQRKFVHELADAYKLYSESQDPEPKRSVFVYKLQGSYLPERDIQQEIAQLSAIEQKKKEEHELYLKQLQEELYNCILFEDLFFGVTIEKIETQVLPMLDNFHLDKSNITFQLMNRNAAIVATESSIETENHLYLLTKHLKNWIREKNIAFDCRLTLLKDGKLIKEEKVFKREEQKKLHNESNPFEELDDSDGRSSVVSEVEVEEQVDDQSVTTGSSEQNIELKLTNSELE